MLGRRGSVLATTIPATRNAGPTAEMLGHLVIDCGPPEAGHLTMPAQRQKCWDTVDCRNELHCRPVMPAQRQRYWDRMRLGAAHGVAPSRNASPTAKMLGHREVLDDKVVAARNANPTAEMLGPLQSEANYLPKAPRNTGPTAEMLGLEFRTLRSDENCDSQCRPNGRDIETLSRATKAATRRPYNASPTAEMLEPYSRVTLQTSKPLTPPS